MVSEIRFFFHKSNRADFNRQVDKAWQSLPDHGGSVCDMRAQKDVMPVSIRRYYFKFVIKPIADYTGHSLEDLHDYFKSRFGSMFADEDGQWDPNTLHIFRNDSDMDEADKESFIREVRDFAEHWLDVETEPWKGVD